MEYHLAYHSEGNPAIYDIVDAPGGDYAKRNKAYTILSEESLFLGSIICTVGILTSAKHRKCNALV